ncbi:hypothetical protein HB943_00535 [Listeria weihenstephanensis]|uniref:Bacterial Ig domain-containing protein n=1 Tax=Listeria weihenstephanensis TaxID=1006155 RepID=A0A841Z3P4_9LIST|nr:Ig-like domain-containing protein [Listeria weihenstephanensis]MBC1499067.1 hypothetical protein [Listeria weihenstephanensis]
MKKKIVAIALTIMMPAPMFAGVAQAEVIKEPMKVSQTLKTGAMLGATIQTKNLFKDASFTLFGNQGNQGWLYSQAGLFDNSLALSRNMVATGDEYKVTNPIDYQVYVKPLQIENEAAIQIRDVTDNTGKVNSSFGQQMSGLVVGKSYTVSADYRVASSNITDGKNELYFSVGKLTGDGLKTDKSLENTSVTIANDDTTWKHYSKTFTATATTQLIAFGQFPNSTDAGQQLVTQYKNLQLVDADQTPPEAPTASKVYPTSNTVTGKTEAGAKISVKVNGTEIGTTTANGSGDYTVTIPVQPKDTILEITAQDASGNISDVTKVTVKEEVFAVAKPQTMILGTDISKMDPKTFLQDIKNDGTNMTIAFGNKASTGTVGTANTEVKVTDNTTQVTQTILVPTTIEYGDTIFASGIETSGSSRRGVSAITIHHGANPYLTNTVARYEYYSYIKIHSYFPSTYVGTKVSKVTDDHILGTPYFAKSANGTDTVDSFVNNYGTPEVEYGDVLEFYHAEGKAWIEKAGEAEHFDATNTTGSGTTYYEITPDGYKQVLKNNITTKSKTINTGETVQASDFVTLPAGSNLSVADTFIQAPNVSKVGTSTVEVEVDEQLNSGKYLKRTFTSTITVKDTIAPTADTITQTLDKGASIPAASTFLTNVHDNADADVANNISISYVTPPTTATIGVRTAQIAIQDKAGNKTIKNVTYSVKDENTKIQDNYMLHSGDTQLNTSDLEGKTSEQVATLLRQQAKVQGWDMTSGADLTNQVTLESPVPTTSGTYTLTYKLGTATATSHVEIKDNTTFGFTETPSALGFNTTEIKSSETTIDREKTDWNVGVTDARNNGDQWTVTATVNGPFENMTDPTAKKLMNAFTFTKGTTETRIIDNQAFTIYEGKSDTETNKNIQWEKDQGLRMKVNTTGVKADEDYQTSITWTLNDTP